ncbi:Multidrug efflux pump subunit AcrB [Flavobacterium resistens]|uniref:MMPL family transporter n=1 Tax=Flavobacterium resistens TaxID=443612 RepID=A0A521F9K8_9FLAO|nr:efflux RND transporter permease subunit [Flavobacterium resistens]MRX70071.1 MMPL family transporter [Flavobacterium resistens]SMO92843.1 Multidrug efflux pump subunit AcrB [Flavobacterium resistens]
MVKFLINKPIAVLMTTLCMLILGLYAFGFIPVALMPNIDIPEITVQVEADNMSARQVEDVIVKNLRSNLVQVSHLKDIKTESTNGSGVIRLSFEQGTKIDYSFIEVNEKIDRAMGNLPKTIERPKVIKANITDVPVFYLSMTLKDQGQGKANVSATELYPVSQQFVDFSRFANQVIRKRIEQVEEVAMVDVSGLVFSEIRIIPDMEKLDALGLSLNELESAIKTYDVEIGSLLIKDNQYQYNVRLGSSLNTIQEIENIYIKKSERLFQLKDLAEVIEHPQKRTGLVLSDDQEAITMAVIQQSDAKMENLKTSLNRLVERLKKEYPTIEFSITRDQTKLLDYSISNIKQDLVWGILLAFGIMFLFLKDVKSPLLIGISVPVSLTVSLVFFYVFNISINVISLSGLILGIGLMIDNSIIVIENIIQYREQKYALTEACILGTNEIIKPLFSSVLTTCSVFLPLSFLSGISGALFYDQAMAITIGLFVSLIVSVCLVPLLYRLFHLKESGKKNKIDRFLERTNTLDYAELYEKGFRFVMKEQKKCWAICILLLVIGVVLFRTLPKTRMPYLTKTEMVLKIDWNKQIDVEENKKRVLELLQPLKKELLNYTALVGSQQFILDKESTSLTSESAIYISCDSSDKLEKIKYDINLFMLKKYKGALFSYSEVDNIFNIIFSDKEAPLVAKLQNTENLGSTQNTQLKKVLNQVQQNVADLTLKPIAWQEHIDLVADQEKLMTYGVSTNTLFDALKSAFNEREILSVIDNQNFVPVILGGETKTLDKVLRETMVQSKDSAVFHASDFIKTIHYQDMKSIVGGIEGEYYPIELNTNEKTVDQTIDKIKQVVKENKLYTVSFSGSIFNNQELLKELVAVLLISLLLLYFILASQFESLILPFIILIEIPLDLAGAFLLLKIFGMSLNLMSMIGIVVMSGIVINDSILKIDTIIQLQRQGNSLIKALLIAGQRRLKPILMTSLTTILAVIPLLFTGGLGAELQAPLATVLTGGMILGTIISLYFTPLCYYYFAKRFEVKAKK